MDAENVDIKVWAQQVREIKIREMRELIAETEKKFAELQADTFDSACERTRNRLKLLRLNLKLDILLK